MPQVAPYIGRLKWNDKIIGTGFVVHESGLIATCYHVLKAVGEPFVGKTFTFEPLIDLSQPILVTALDKFDQVHDVALLQTNEALPKEVGVARLVLSSAAKPSMHFETWGFGRLADSGHRNDFLPADGTVRGQGQRNNIDLLVLNSGSILLGMSGAPVILPELGGVIGVISGRYTPPRDEFWYADTIWVARTEHLVALDPKLLHIRKPLAPRLVSDRQEYEHLIGSSKIATYDQDRQPMIDLMRRIWITGFLADSLYYNNLMSLELKSTPQMVSGRMDSVVPRPKPITPSPSANTASSIESIFDNVGQNLLILGSPGAGKSTVMIELMRLLLIRAEDDSNHPIPVIFQLSKWASHRGPLTSWLIEDLVSTYLISRKVAESWVSNAQILPLLDGLDEMPTDYQLLCVRAINIFRQQYGFLPIVVCCRTEKYAELFEKILLDGAITIQPLTPQQVIDFVDKYGELREPIDTVLRDDQILWELLNTPLWLYIFILAYGGRSIEELRAQPDLRSRRTYLLAIYVERMFERKRTPTRYSQAQSIDYLQWLAWSMQERNQTDFRLEQMQPDLLPPSQRWLPLSGVAITTGLVVGLVVTLLDGLGMGLGIGLLAGITAFWPRILVVEKVGWVRVTLSTKFRLEDLITLLVTVLLCGLSVGLGVALSVALTVWLGGWVGGCLVGGMLLIMVIAIATGVKDKGENDSIDNAIGGNVTVQKLQYPVWSLLIVGPLLGMLFGLIIALNVEFVVGLRGELLSGLRIVLLTALGVGLASMLYTLVFATPIWLGFKFTYGRIKQRIVPNEGIYKSGWNAVILGIIHMLAGWLFIGLSLSFVIGLHGALLIGWSGSWVFGMWAMLRYGGRATLQHYTLRLLLAINRHTPLWYVCFLDDMVDRILLHRRGGAYVFLHRILLDYFAAQYSSKSSPTSGPTTSDATDN